MNLTQPATATTINDSAPASFTCADCPFARLIEDNRYCCTVSQTASDVKRGHWEATVSCHEAIAIVQAETEAALAAIAAEVEALIAQAATHTTEQTLIAPTKPAAIPAPTKPAATTAAAPTTPTVIGTNGDEALNRGENGRGRVQPTAHPKNLCCTS
jgi:hypothetical protein